MQVRFSVEHLGLAARDTVTLAKWYERTLGGELFFRCENAGRPSTIFVRLAGGLILEIYPANRSGGEASDNLSSGWRHLALQVQSLASTRAGLESHGVTFVEPVKPAGGGGQVLFFADPEGNLLHLVERPTDSIFAQSPDKLENG